MWERIKEFLTDPFHLHVSTAILSIICAGLAFVGGRVPLGLIWAGCAICEIYFAYCDTNEEN